LDVLLELRPNPGDALFMLALAIYAVYSALLKRRPSIHWLSFLGVTVACGAAMLLPATAVEFALGARPEPTAGNAFALLYVVVFPSVVAYAFFNRGVELIGPNRTGPFFHLVPLFGVVLAVALLGERLELAHVSGAALIAAGVVVASVRRPAPAGA
jgi:drug/metabolite transporter (DMT)-like permease